VDHGKPSVLFRIPKIPAKSPLIHELLVIRRKLGRPPDLEEDRVGKSLARPRIRRQNVSQFTAYKFIHQARRRRLYIKQNQLVR